MTQEEFNVKVVEILDMIWTDVKVRNSYVEGAVENRIDELQKTLPLKEKRR